jgi:transcriptional regulator NrdR family protein
MSCPVCHSEKSLVKDYLQVKQWMYIVTSRMCSDCGRVYSTDDADEYNPTQFAVGAEPQLSYA